MIFPPIRSARVQSRPPAARIKEEVDVGENFRISTSSSCAESCTSEQRRKRKGEKRRWTISRKREEDEVEVDETLGGHTVNRVLPPPRGSWPETIHSRGNLEDGTNERFSVSASNCE